MQTINGTGGLCMTCNNAPSCYHRATRGPALFCELFSDYVPPFERNGSTRTPLRIEPAGTLRASAEDPENYSGLCMNCRHRGTCGHPGATGGVWHCEDYE